MEMDRSTITLFITIVCMFLVLVGAVGFASAHGLGTSTTSHTTIIVSQQQRDAINTGR